MAEFLDEADKLRSSSPEDREQFDLVFKGRAALQQVHSMAQLDILNIESVFAAFEMAQLTGRLGNLTA